MFELPHIKYISTSNFSDLYYLGGENKENDEKLTIGKEYTIRITLYSPRPGVDRTTCYICTGDAGDIRRINLKNFGEFRDLRNYKIESIINK